VVRRWGDVGSRTGRRDAWFIETAMTAMVPFGARLFGAVTRWVAVAPWWSQLALDGVTTGRMPRNTNRS
jgi:hypothetical protein